MRLALDLALAAAAAMVGPHALIAQTGPPADRDPPDATPAQFETMSGAEGGEFDREVFVYPAGDRRDPFQRLLPGASEGPRFEELRLIGVVHSPDPQASVALIELAGARAPTPGDLRERTLRLRQDVVLGDMRVVRIEREHLIVEIDRFGLEERLELRLDRQPGRNGR